jgi:hypothetical protein
LTQPLGDNTQAFVPNLGSLPTTTQWALESMYYNGPGTLGGRNSDSITYKAARRGDLVTIAEQIAFNSSNADSGQPGLEERYLGSAMLALGVIPTFNGFNQITSVDASGAQLSDIQNFMSQVLSGAHFRGVQTAAQYVGDWGSNPQTMPIVSYNTIIKQLEGYLLSQHSKYVLQDDDTSLSVALNHMNAIEESLGLPKLDVTVADLEVGVQVASLDGVTRNVLTPGMVIDVERADQSEVKSYLAALSGGAAFLMAA